MDPGADTGDILSQRETGILYEDDADSLYNKVMETAVEQLEELIYALKSRKEKRISQSGCDGNSWRKRVLRMEKLIGECHQGVYITWSEIC